MQLNALLLSFACRMLFYYIYARARASVNSISLICTLRPNLCVAGTHGHTWHTWVLRVCGELSVCVRVHGRSPVLTTRNAHRPTTAMATASTPTANSNSTSTAPHCKSQCFRGMLESCRDAFIYNASYI